MEKYAIIVAGGAGMRMGSKLPKQFLLLNDRPILWHSINAFLHAYDDIHIILVLPEEYMEEGRSIMQHFPNAAGVTITSGGASRFESVKNGLHYVPEGVIVFVHDGVRCLVTPALIRRCYETAREKGNAVPAVKAIDTLRVETASGNYMINREEVRIVQTPQTFLSDTLKEAFLHGYDASFTDDASVVERDGHAIFLVEGEVTNLKITTQTDLLVAGKILEARNQ